MGAPTVIRFPLERRIDHEPRPYRHPDDYLPVVVILPVVRIERLRPVRGDAPDEPGGAD